MFGSQILMKYVKDGVKKKKPAVHLGSHYLKIYLGH